MLFVARQPVRVGERTLTPSILSCAVEPDPAKASAAEQILAEAVAGLSRRVLAAPMGSSTLIKRGEEQFVLEQGLARAIEEGQLSMVFQPLVNANLGRVIGAEALLRWVHPELGPVSPARFIPLVEELGLIDRYGLWVLNAACREAARWRALGLAELRMAVNLSARQVSDPQLEIKIERTAVRHGVALGTLELELTETAVMADASRTLDLFTRLRARGVGLAIDDFGAGYSSLSYLKNLPFTKLKIDREFVSNIDTEPSGRAICKALLELGRGLGLVVLAEGVETAEELAVLRRLGCDVFQGFHFSKPLSGDDFLRFIPTFERGDPLPGVQLDEFSA
jgi:EAL domain-containing protein (putative c-di-GMP-specific phosphodiesterase class I)